MKRRIPYIVLGTLFYQLALVSCQPEPLDIVVAALPPKPVVFSQVAPDRVMVVALTKSFGALDFNEDEDDLTRTFVDNLLLTDAEVTISYSGRTDTLIAVEKGLYASLNTLRIPNEIYELKVKSELGVTTAQSKMLRHVRFDSLRPRIKREGEVSKKLWFSFKDPPGENFYVMQIYRRQVADGIDLNSEFGQNENVNVQTVLITDQAYKDGRIEQEIELEEIEVSDTIAVSLSNVEEEYYNYLTLRRRSQNLVTELTKEPITYPTNVRNGYGYFITHYPDIRILDLNRY